MVGKFKKFVDVVGQEIKEALINDPYIFACNFFFWSVYWTSSLSH